MEKQYDGFDCSNAEICSTAVTVFEIAQANMEIIFYSTIHIIYEFYHYCLMFFCLLHLFMNCFINLFLMLNYSLLQNFKVFGNKLSTTRLWSRIYYILYPRVSSLIICFSSISDFLLYSFISLLVILTISYSFLFKISCWEHFSRCFSQS